MILPIKIGTLDFWKIADKNMELSDIAVDIVRQSELVSYEKFENSEKLKGKNQKQDKYIYFRVEQKVKNKKIMANRFVLKFLSMHNKCKGLE